MFIKQISVFLENRQGTLRELTHLLGASGIDLMALSLATRRISASCASSSPTIRWILRCACCAPAALPRG